MANKRMFCKDIVDSDAFLDMPLSAQALYFHLGMAADDDGFVGNPRRLQRVIGCNDDDMKVLIGKRFVIGFPSGVVVIKHHRMNNNWDKHNCKRTVYTEEFQLLSLKENKAYTLDISKGVSVQSVFSLEPVFRREENRINKADKSASKKKDMGNWNRHSDNDTDLPAVDYETGNDIPSEEEEERRKNQQFLKLKKEMVAWLIKHQERDTTKLTQSWRRKQFAALNELIKMKTPRTVMIDSITKLEKSDYWKNQGSHPDFKTVISLIQNKK